MIETARPQPKVSIVYLCENAAKSIEPSIYSVFQQTHINWELLIVDCNSEDASVHKAQVLATKGPQQAIKILEFPTSDRNIIQKKLQSYITGKYLFIFSQGDILHPVCLEELVRVLEEDSSAAFAYSAYIPFEGEIGSSQYFEAASVSPGQFNPDSLVFFNQFPSSLLFRRTHRVITIDYTQFYFLLDYCLQHLTPGNKAAYVGVPLVSQPKDRDQSFSYYHASITVARNRQHFSEQVVNWHTAIENLWSDPASCFTLCIVGSSQEIENKPQADLLVKLCEIFNDAGHNSVYLVPDLDQPYVNHNTPVFSFDRSKKGDLEQQLAALGDNLFMVVLQEADYGFYINSLTSILYKSLIINSIEAVKSEALKSFDLVVEQEFNFDSKALADCCGTRYLGGADGVQEFLDTALDQCKSQKVLKDSQKLLQVNHLKLVNQSLSRDLEVENIPKADFAIVLLVHDCAVEDILRSIKAWETQDFNAEITFQVVVYGNRFQQLDLFARNTWPCEVIDESGMHSRAVAANRAAKLLKQEWLLFIDAQNIVAPYFVRILNHYILHMRRASCFYGKATRLLPMELPTAWKSQSFYEWMHVGMCTWWHECDGCLLIKNKLLKDLGGFSEAYAMWPYEFDDLLQRLRWNAQELCELPRGSVLKPWNLHGAPGVIDRWNRNFLEELYFTPQLQARSASKESPKYLDYADDLSEEYRSQREAIVKLAVKNSTKQAERLSELAIDLAQNAHHNIAMECMQQAVFLEPNNKNYVELLSEIYKTIGHVEAFQRCIDRLNYLDKA